MNDKCGLKKGKWRGMAGNVGKCRETAGNVGNLQEMAGNVGVLSGWGPYIAYEQSLSRRLLCICSFWTVLKINDVSGCPACQ